MARRRYRRNALSRSRSGFRAAASRRRNARYALVQNRRRRFRTLRGRAGRWARYKNLASLDMLRTKLTYFENIPINPTQDFITPGAGQNFHQFRVNSLFDPDYTGTGHQPMYHDNYSQLWNKYRVVSSKITATIVTQRIGGVNSGATPTEIDSSTFRMFISKDEDLDVPAAFGPLIEEGGSNIKFRYVAPSMTGRLPSLSMSCSPHKLLRCGRNDNDLAGNVGGTGVGTNPAKVGYYTVGVSSADGIVNPPVMNIAIKIEFNVEYFDRKLVQPQN